MRIPHRRYVVCAHCGHSRRRWVWMSAWQTLRCTKCGRRFAWLAHPTGQWSATVNPHHDSPELQRIVEGYFRRGFDRYGRTGH